MEKPPRLISRRDVTTILALCAHLVVSWTVPQRLWPIASFGFATVGLVTRPRDARSRMRRFTRILPILRGRAQLRLLLKSDRASLEARFQYLREHRPGRWRPPIRLRGHEHIVRALDSGHGVILWVSMFVFGFLVSKKSLHAAGFEITHLSSLAHGLSASRFGMRFLNPIISVAENRYLIERIPVSLDRSIGYLKRVVNRLRENHIVSVTASAHAERPRTAPFHGKYLQLACGAPSLALATNAALLPVFTVRTESGEFEVVVEAPLRMNRSGDRQETIDHLLRDYATLLEPYVLKYPWQYIGWGSVVESDTK